jgi:hypothetical protein
MCILQRGSVRGYAGGLGILMTWGPALIPDLTRIFTLVVQADSAR